MLAREREGKTETTNLGEKQKKKRENRHKKIGSEELTLTKIIIRHKKKKLKD